MNQNALKNIGRAVLVVWGEYQSKNARWLGQGSGIDRGEFNATIRGNTTHADPVLAELISSELDLLDFSLEAELQLRAYPRQYHQLALYRYVPELLLTWAQIGFLLRRHPDTIAEAHGKLQARLGRDLVMQWRDRGKKPAEQPRESDKKVEWWMRPAVWEKAVA